MPTSQKIAVWLFFAFVLLFSFGAGLIARRRVNASEFNEVKPYVFAELPHGRIYKTVHEGCELYVVESDVTIPSGQYGMPFGTEVYSITAGKGCK
jgi:hypothetical protein